ncbi:MAG: tetratricopeptide repeat protein [bacterium]
MKRFNILVLIITFTQVIICKSIEENIVYNVINIEKEAGYEIPDSVLVLLDNILKKASENIKTKQQYTKKEALKILQQISDIHKELGIRTKLHLHGDLFVNGLIEKKFDCGNYVLTYLGIAEILKLPLYAVEAPGHIFLHFRCKNNDSLYWETLYSCEKDRKHYIEHHHINETSIKSGYYLRDLSIDDVISSRLVTIATKFRESKDFDNALKFDKKAIILNSKNISAFLGLGITYMEMKNYNQAKEYFNRTIELNNDWSTIYSNLGVLNQSQKMYDSALYYFDKSINIDSNDYVVFHNRSNVYILLGEFEKALIDINKAISIESGLDGVWSASLKQKGDILYRQEKYNEAILEYTKSIELDSNSKFAFCNKGLSYVAIKDYISALFDFTKAIQIDSAFINAYANRGRLYYYFFDEYEKAINDMKFSLAMDTSLIDLYNLIGLSNYFIGNYQESINWFNKYIQKNPDDMKAYTDRADSYLELNKCDSAYRDYESVIYKKKDKVTTDDFEGFLNCLLYCNLLNQAEEQLKNAELLYPSHYNWKIYEFYIHVLNNKFEDANSIFENEIENNQIYDKSEILEELHNLKTKYKENVVLDYFIKKIPDK